MDRKALLAFLGLGALVFALGGCTDAGDPHFPGPSSMVTVTDLVGDWDNLVIVGETTGADGVSMSRDGITWTGLVLDLHPGTNEFAIFTNDDTKALVEVASGFKLEVGDDGIVSGDQNIVIEPSAGTGFILLVVNHDPAYDNIKIKGSMNGWSPAITGHSADNVHWYLHFDAEAVAAGNYEWGVIEDDGSQWGIWLVVGPNLTFSVDEQGVPSGTTSYTVEAPEPITTLTLNCDTTGFAGEITAMGVSGTFDNWANPPTTMMTDENSDGIYTVTLEIEQSQRVLFKFRLNGAWESVPASCGVDDNNGGNNRFIDIGTSPATYTSAYEGCPE